MGWKKKQPVYFIYVVAVFRIFQMLMMHPADRLIMIICLKCHFFFAQYHKKKSSDQISKGNVQGKRNLFAMFEKQQYPDANHGAGIFTYIYPQKLSPNM